MATVVGCLLSYLLGAVPFALLLVRWIKGQDIRALGSGNVGATNASRAFAGRGKLAMFLLIYVLDFAKGFVPAYLLPQWFAGPEARGVLFGACAIAGHCASPFLRFRGGKGVATTTGVMAALDPIALAVGLGVFFAVFAATRRVFLGSLALGVALAATVVLREPETAFGPRVATTVFVLLIAVFLFFTHRSNLAAMFKAA